MNTAIAEVFAKNVTQMPIDADSGTRMGGNASRRRIEPRSTTEGSIAETLSTKNQYSRIPISRKIVKLSVWFDVLSRWAKTSQSTPKYASGFASDQR